MKKSCLSNIVLTVFLLCSVAGNADDSHVYFVSVTETDETHATNPYLKEDEQIAAEAVAVALKDVNFFAIYCSEAPHAIQTAHIIANYHECPVVIHPTLNGFHPLALFKKVGALRALGRELHLNNNGQTVCWVVHHNLMNIIGKRVYGIYKKIPDLSYVQLDYDETGVHLSRTSN